MKNKKYWCAFSKLTKAGSAFVNNIYNWFGDIELAWHAQAYDLWQIPNLQKRSIEGFLEERPNVDPDECLDYIEQRGIQFICLEDEEYPTLLKNIFNPPVGLFVVGNLKSCNLDRCLAVVGSRKASESAKINLTKILSGFQGTDITIVSGMAEGIDTIAHKAAINNNIKTVAVIGGGFDKIYPKSNIGLFNQIKEIHGAVISEYWPDADAISWHFPARNRIVCGLSKGVLVAEAALKSGAMISAGLALEQGKELMCMPGLISNPNTAGIYKLIKNGATIVTDYNDILDALNWKINSNIIPQKADTSCSNNGLNENENLVLEYIKKDALSVDELIIKTNLNINDLMVILTKLELEGIISQTNGEKYMALI